MRDFFDPIVPAIVDWQGAMPRSEAYQDGYFGSGDGLAEAQCVFIEANDLANRFGRLKPGEVFVIGETGFGTGLNMLLAAQCFEQHAPLGAYLQLISTDLHPLRLADLKRALALWPSLGPWAEPLLRAYPPAAPGHHRLALTDHIELTLMWGEALDSWSASSAAVDAWFLDGFSPAQNPAMWSEILFQTLFKHSRAGATLGTFTAAGHVRQGLAKAGFVVEKVDGFSHKRHRSLGHTPGDWSPAKWRQGRAVIAGAGLAGATTSWALAKRGWDVDLWDPNPPASGGSGNLAGVVYATPSPHLQAQNRFYLGALIRALAWFDRLGFPATENDGRLSDVWLHLAQARRQKNAHKAAQTGAWPPELLAMTDETTACLKGAGYIHPAAWIRRLMDHPNIRYQQKPLKDWADVEADAIVLANADAVKTWPALAGLPIKAIRGQVTEIQATESSQKWTQAHCHVGYLTPAIHGRHCIGATYDLHQAHIGAVASDDQTNLAQLATHLPQQWAELGGEDAQVVGQRAAMRCTTPDRLPVVGEVHHIDARLFLNVGHGSRGITHTPLCADVLADLICDNWKLGGHGADANIINALRPARFLDRKDAL